MFTMSLRLLIAPIPVSDFMAVTPTVRQETGEAVPAPVVKPKQAASPAGEEIVAGLLDPAEPGCAHLCDPQGWMVRLIGSIGIRLFAYRSPEPTGATRWSAGRMAESSGGSDRRGAVRRQSWPQFRSGLAYLI
jgi:hypothetical protein